MTKDNNRILTCEIPDCNKTENLKEAYIPDDNNQKVYFCKKHYKEHTVKEA